MDDQTLETLRSAYNRLAGGDIDAIVPVLDPDVHWRGRPRGLLHRSHPYWHGSEEARAVLQGMQKKTLAASPDTTATITVERGDSEQAIVTYIVQPGDRRHFQVVNVRQGKIVHIQDVRTRKEALALAGIRR